MRLPKNTAENNKSTTLMRFVCFQAQKRIIAHGKKIVISPGKARTFNLLMCNQASNADNSQTR